MTIEIKFTGLCSFVPNTDEAANKVTVLLVDATGKNGVMTLVDGLVGRKHFPVLKFNTYNLENRGSLPDNQDVQMSLYGQEIWFEYPLLSSPLSGLTSSPPSSPAACEILGQQRPKRFKLGKAVENGNQDHFGWGVEMGRVLGGALALLRKATLDENPNATFDEDQNETLDEDPNEMVTDDEHGRVGARVILRSGRLVSAEKLPVDTKLFNVPGLGSGLAYSLEPLSHSASLILEGAGGLVVNLWPFKPPFVQREVRFAPGDFSLEIGNLCGDSLFGAEPEAANRVDRDFLWHFELCEYRNRIATILGPDPELKVIPVPHFINEGGVGGREVQCMRATFSAP